MGDKEPGDIATIPWVRYDDPETKTFKLNAERQNGRAAMLGITGCLIHELLGVLLASNISPHLLAFHLVCAWYSCVLVDWLSGSSWHAVPDSFDENLARAS